MIPKSLVRNIFTSPPPDNHSTVRVTVTDFYHPNFKIINAQKTNPNSVSWMEQLIDIHKNYNSR